MPSNLTDITDNQGNHCIRRFSWRTFLLVMVFPASLIGGPSSAQTSPENKFTVTIDAGHGGHDTGAPGKKSVEKNIALAIALKLGHNIENLMEDVDVYYTRKTDVFVPLYERAQIANRNKSDVFISIHVNANKKSTPTGTSTYVMGFSRSAENLDLVMQENKAILLEKDYQTRYAFDPTSPESYIIFNNVQNNNLTQSLEIAAAVQDQLRNHGQRKDIGVHQGNLVVLWGCAKPSVLIETGFISNPQEEQFLMTENGQEVIASSIYLALREYKESVDAKVGNLAKVAAPDTAKIKSSGSAVEKTQVVVEKAPEVVKVIREDVRVPAMADTAGKLPEPEIEYRVQVLASKKKLSPDARDFKGIKDLKEIKTDGYYKYMTQSVNTYQEALELRRKLGDSFHEAFIVAFKNGERVPLNTLIDQKKN